MISDVFNDGIITNADFGAKLKGNPQLYFVPANDRARGALKLMMRETVAAFERVFETGHVYRAEPHASSRHLTEYYSLDLEFGFIDSAEDVIRLEKELLTWMFAKLTENQNDLLRRLNAAPLPSLMDAPVWEFGECLDRLTRAHGKTHLTDDLDPEAERRLCALAQREAGVPAVFVVGFPASGRPFYSAPRGTR